jgi:hypothetical protein
LTTGTQARRAVRCRRTGLTSLIDPTEEDYVEVATRLAGDLDAPADLRAGLREVMRPSPPTRAAWRSPRSVTTGTPIHSASQVVVVPLTSGSSVMSTRP